MFGYLAASEPDLSPEELRRYQAHYCGICRAIGVRAGQRCRVVLDHDLVFLSLLHGSLSDNAETERPGRCLVHPLRAHRFLNTTHTDYAADLNVALAYHKALDDWTDDHSVPARGAAALLEAPYQRIRARLSRQCEAIEQGLAAISEIEHASHSNPDEAAALFGRIMGELFVDDPTSVWAPSLYALGERLGRFIYLMDALCDVERDRARGRYNPLVGMDGAVPVALDALEVLAGQVAAVFEKLPLERDLHLLRSVIYRGMWSRWRTQEARRTKQTRRYRSEEINGSPSPAPSCPHHNRPQPRQPLKENA